MKFIMASKLIQTNPHEAENQFEITLIQSFQLFKTHLKPPFPFTIPSPSDYLHLNRAILFALLTHPQSTKLYLTHLHATVTDAYKFFLSLVSKLVFESYTQLIDSVKVQLICVTRKLVEVSAEGIEELLFCLLRQIVGGDYRDGNLWLCVELIRLFMDNWDWLVEERPFLLKSALFTYMRLLADHYRLSGGRFEALKRLEIEFCVGVLRNHFDLCLQIGRDLVRLLQDLVYIPEFKAIWKDLLLNPSEFSTPGFSDISHLYCLRTSSKYFLLRITPEMETQLRFLLTHVKWGFHRRYQLWFAKKFLSRPESETLISDIVRFICCAHHPSNDIIQSNVIPRWATIGWLLTCCSSAHVEANTKLALLYDWMFYNEGIDRVMNIEPAVLLMVHSIPQYIDVTRTLLDFLFHLVDNYDEQRKDIIAKAVSTAFSLLVRARVVHSLDVFRSCPLLSPILKAKLVKISSFPAVHLPHRAVLLPNLENASNTETQISLPTKSTFKPPKENETTQVNPDRCSVDIMEDLFKRLGECFKISNNLGLHLLEELLFSFVNCDSQSIGVGAPVGSILNPETLACQITEVFKSSGYDMCVPFKHPLKSICGDDNQSATPLVLCTFMFCQNRRTQELLLFWSRNDYPVGSHFLYYASTLAYESHKIGCSISPDGENKSAKISDSETPALKYHIDKYVSFNRARGKHYLNVHYGASSVDSKHISELIEGAFASYKSFLTLDNSEDASLAQFIFSDLMSCCEWEKNHLKELLWSIVHYLPDLTTGKEDFIRSLVEKLDYADLNILQFELSLENLSIFGKDIEVLFQLIGSSLSWGFVEQQKFWALMISEQANSKINVERLVVDFFSLKDFNPSVHSIAIGGLFTLCSRRVPTPDFVCSMISLPDNIVEGFAASVLANWVVSNGPKLFDCLGGCLENRGKDDTSPFFSNTGVRLNHSTIMRFLEFLDKLEMDCTGYMSNLSVSVREQMQKFRRKSFNRPDDNDV